MTWNEETSRERIKASWQESAGVVVKPLVKETSLDNLSLQTAYLVDGVHVYVDIPNALVLLGADLEGDHKKLLRFLNVLARVSHLALVESDATKVDVQSTRLHFIVYRPYDSERARVSAAIAIAEALSGALLASNALHTELPDARVVIGIESGTALAVRNGTRGDREPLFLGNPANHAAKLTGADQPAGIYVGAVARAALGDAYFVSAPTKTPLTTSQINACVAEAALGISSERIAEAWAREVAKNPISSFTFSRWTPPLAAVDLDQLTPGNSRRQELVVIYADIDGFTQFVEDAIISGTMIVAVRVLHVIRKELRDVLCDFSGKKVRYIGDCIQGILVEGTAQTTDEPDSVRSAALCAAAMRSSMSIVRAEIPDASALDIQIGFELGATSVSRVGVQGSRDRIVVGRTSLRAEDEQRRCAARETAIGPAAYAAAPQAIKDAFGVVRKANDIDYDRLCARLRRNGETGVRQPIPPAIPNSIRPRAYGE